MNVQQKFSWKDEILEQLTLAKMLSETSKLTSGRRISLILIDNVIEYILKLYGSKFVPNKLPRKRWENVKRNFHSLMNFVKDNSKSQDINWDDIRRYHETRNMLYHEPLLPLTVDAKVIKRYTAIALNLLRELFNQAIDRKELDFWRSRIKQALIATKPSKAIVRIIKLSEEKVRIKCQEKITLTDGIRLVIYSFSSEIGRPPNKDELYGSLLASGIQIDKKTLSARLSEMRRNGILRRNQNILTRKAVKKLLEKFFITTESSEER